MDPSAFATEIGARLPVLLLSALVGLVGALVAGVAMLSRPRHPLLVLAPVAIPLAASAVAAWVALVGVIHAPLPAVVGAVGLSLVGWWVALPALAVAALFSAVAGGRGPRRRWGPAGAVFALAVATAAVTLAGGIVEEDWLYPLVRAAVYVAFGALAAAAHLGADGEAPTDPLAAASGGGVFVLVVAAGEVSARALEHVFLLAVLPAVLPEGRVAYVDQASVDVIAPSAPWHVATSLLGALTGVLAIALSTRRDRKAPLAALLALVLAVLLDRCGHVSRDVLVLVAESVPAPASP